MSATFRGYWPVQVAAIVRTESTRRRAPLPVAEPVDPAIPDPIAEPPLPEPPLVEPPPVEPPPNPVVEPDDVVPAPLTPEPPVIEFEPSMWPVTSTCSPT